jgi:hypothetical protein
MIASPQSFIVSTECSKLAEQNGFRRRLGDTNGWSAFRSTTAQGTIWLAAEGPNGPWFLALDHTGVIEELDISAADMLGPGIARYAFETLSQVYAVFPRIYQLAVSLPDAPLREFETKTNYLPKTTEAERLVVQRIGQDIFRAGLIDYWQARCPLTGITDTALLRASHILPWKNCTSDAERLDIYNGLLLSALWDAAFDQGLVTFDDEGQPQFSPSLSDIARAELRWQGSIPLTDKHRERLSWHRSNLFIKKSGWQVEPAKTGNNA